jgi:hypothetical protein
MASAIAAPMLIPAIAPALNPLFDVLLESVEEDDVGPGKLVGEEAGDAFMDALAAVVDAGTLVGVKGILSLDASADA